MVSGPSTNQADGMATIVYIFSPRIRSHLCNYSMGSGEVKVESCVLRKHDPPGRLPLLNTARLNRMLATPMCRRSQGNDHPLPRTALGQLSAKPGIKPQAVDVAQTYLRSNDKGLYISCDIPKTVPAFQREATPTSQAQWTGNG